MIKFTGDDLEKMAEREKQMQSVTLWGGLINIILMLLKFIIGFISGSAALVADGVHSLSDLATDFIVLISSRYSNRPPDATHPFGHKKIETIAAQFIAVILMLVSGILIWSSFKAVIGGEKNFPGVALLIVAGISVIMKEFIFRITRKIAKKTLSASLYANAWHHRSDALSSIAVLLGGAAGLFGWGLADPAAAIVVGFMVLAVSLKIFYQGLVELMEHAADSESIRIIKGVLNKEKRITGWHALRTRKLGGELFLDVHITMDPDLTVKESHAISEEIEEKIQKRLSVPANILIHIEPNSKRE
ncbi:MAG: cation transporter [Candidatus Aminicenantes bacterium]|nr:cation transporter [Candidatus Aminicenantes bacterium]